MVVIGGAAVGQMRNKSGATATNILIDRAISHNKASTAGGCVVSREGAKGRARLMQEETINPQNELEQTGVRITMAQRSLSHHLLGGVPVPVLHHLSEESTVAAEAMLEGGADSFPNPPQFLSLVLHCISSPSFQSRSGVALALF